MSMVKVFIAEDDPLMARLYERVFKLEGFEVEIGSDGEEAITKLEMMEKKPTLILLDIMMPKLSGFDVLRHIKTKLNLKNIPVVMLTNLAGQDDAEKALELGAVLYLVKSQYEPKEIVNKVKEIIKGYTRDQEVTEAPSVSVPVKKLPSK